MGQGAAFMKLANGIQLIAIYLPIRSVSKIYLNYLAHLHPALTMFSNLFITYINIVIPLVAFIMIGVAARKLYFIAKAKFIVPYLYALMLIFCFIGVTFCYAAFESSKTLSPSDWLITIQYNLPIRVQIMTIIIPNLFTWFIGLVAAYDIYLYQTQVKGIFYRKSLKLLSIGLTLEICSSILVQYITIIAASIQRRPTSFMVTILFSVIILTIVAFILIARGVQKLKRLESI